MGAFDGYKLPRPIHVIDDSVYIPNQSAFCFFKDFQQKDLEKLYEDACMKMMTQFGFRMNDQTMAI